MSNIQVTHVADLNNARSESAIAINPNNPLQIVASSKSFRDIHTYDFTLGTQFSIDGGLTWQESPQPLPLGSDFSILSDPTVTWDDVGNVYLLGLSAEDPPGDNRIGIEAYKSTDGGKSWAHLQPRVHASGADDKQWVAADGNPSSPFHGRIYAAWDGNGLQFARSKDHGASWVGAGTDTNTGTSLANSSFAPEINVAANGDVYIVFVNGSQIQFVISRDGGDTFSAPITAASGITSLGSPDATHFGAHFRSGTLATACAFGQTVLAAWADFRGGVSRIFFARSLDSGVTWVTPASGQPMLTRPIASNVQHFDPQIVCDSNGVIGCAFYEFGPKPTALLIDVLMAESNDGGVSFDDFVVTDSPWDPGIDAPFAHGDPSVLFIGDYFDIAASDGGFYPLWTDTRTGFQDLFTAIVPVKRCVFVMNRSTLGQDEVDARRNQPGGAVVPDVFRVVVDGFSAAELGVTGPGSSLPLTGTLLGVNFVGRGNTSETLGYGPQFQRFTFFYDADFGATDVAFAFPGPVEFVGIEIIVGPTSAQAQIELLKQPDPFILHGDPAWLSIDLRVFVARAGESKFGVPGISGASDAPRFIQQLIQTVTPAQFDSLSTGEDESKLFIEPADGNNVAVFNFALAKVHYIGLIGATDVRVFFRLFQAQTASLAFDFPPGTDYRRATSNPSGQPIPLAGIQGLEYVTLPFFAEQRIDTRVFSMAHQTDNPNVRNIVPHADGSEVDTFFGCWLDINQPSQVCVPLVAPVFTPDGPFNAFFGAPQSIQQSILRSLHQCLIAEIAFDPVAIPPGSVPGNWDKLAQRNLAWADIGSARAVTTFEARPTPATLTAGQLPDELMIDWGSLPQGSTAFLYMSAVTSDEILKLARQMRTDDRLSRIDDHTLQIQTGGVTYVPVPAGSAINYAGLLSVEPAANVRRGEVFNVVVRQITNFTPIQIFASAHRRPLSWRQVLGAFQLTIPVGEKALLLPREERDLSVLRWIGQTVPQTSRWNLVFQRYIDEIAGRVKAFGGDPDCVLPSPTGDARCPDSGDKGEASYTGKISGLIFDHFGDFEGFLLETEHGEHKFSSRERNVEELAGRAWRRRFRVTVVTEPKHPSRPVSIIIRRPPAAWHG